MELIGTLPVTSNAEESFNIVILDVIYSMRQLWNTFGFWTLDIMDEDGNAIVYGVKLVAGINLLYQYPHIPFDLYIDQANEPTRNNITDIQIEIYEKD